MSRKLFFSMLLLFLFTYPKAVDAVTSSEYQNRHQCSSFELAKAEANGSATKVGCYNSYSDAKNAMKSNSNQNLLIFDERNQTKIVDAKYALVDLTVNSLTYFYESPTLTTRLYTSINTSSSYGGVDAALIDVDSSNFAAKVKIANFTGYIAKENYEIVPLIWVKSKSSYTVTSQSIKHNYVAKIQNSYSGSNGSTIGPKPEELPVGTYYSYDGHYFYTSLITMLEDYKNNTYQHAVNKNNPYYNYYMYLSNHTKTTYSSLNIDEYIRNTLGYSKGVYSDKAYNGTSRLYGQGQYFYNTQQVYGVNALLSFSLSRNETGNGRSSLAINKNNGFGLDAVDTNPTQAANWYPTFSKSIFGYASKWTSYGYAYATDWRYFGPSFGDKQNGMNVKYATDAYWSEKMAANYYSFDHSKGLNDYNYYQLGVITQPTKAYLSPSSTSKMIYEYPEVEDQVVIVGEVGSWYKVVSDINIDKNGNLVGSKTDYTKPYNWDSSYVYIEKSKVRLINKGKNGYIAPTSVTSYQDSQYTYDLYIEDNTLKPKVATITKETSYYYDAALLSKKNQKVLKDKWVMVYSACYDKNGNVVSYLVTSNYKYDQKEWVPADSIKFITSGYGKVTVIPTGAYAWVNSTATDRSDNVIGGQFTYSYVPLMTSVNVNGQIWYKVPVNLEGSANSIGYIKASDSDMRVDLTMSYATNHAPVISAMNKTIVQGSKYNPLEGVSASDVEDGNLTSQIKVIKNTVDTNKIGVYEVIYEVTDSLNQKTQKGIQVEVVEDQKPVIEAYDKSINLNSIFDPLEGVFATDKEDGDLTKQIQVIKNTVDPKKKGIYQVIYQVKDSKNHIVTKQVNIEVIEGILKEKEATFYFDYLKKKDGILELKGYQTMKGVEALKSSNIHYRIIFENIDTKEKITDQVERIMDPKEMSRPVFSTDGIDYTYSWFKYQFDFSKVKPGNYRMYIECYNDQYYSKSVVSNKLYREQATSYQDQRYVIIQNNYNDKLGPVEINVRNNLLAKKESSYIYNQFDTYRTFEFNSNDTLHLKGLSYSYGADLGKNKKVERTIIFEDQSNYQTYRYPLDSITNGVYQAVLPDADNLDKTRAWYDKNIDISNIPKGEYVIYITTSSNITDISEFTEKLNRNLDAVKRKINGKNYQFRVNMNKGNRIELIVT